MLPAQVSPRKPTAPSFVGMRASTDQVGRKLRATHPPDFGPAGRIDLLQRPQVRPIPTQIWSTPSSNAVDTARTSVQPETQIAQTWPIRPKSAEHTPKLSATVSHSIEPSRILPNPALKPSPNSRQQPKFSRTQPRVGRSSPKLVEPEPQLVEVNPQFVEPFPIFVQPGPFSAETFPHLAESTPFWPSRPTPSLVEPTPISAESTPQQSVERMTWGHIHGLGRTSVSTAWRAQTTLAMTLLGLVGPSRPMLLEFRKDPNPEMHKT